MKRQLFKYFIGIIFIAGFYSCVSIKPYERIFVNDPEMLMGVDRGKEFEYYVHSIREGATPAGTIIASGGCGCN
jgi:hypothetical protein